MTYTVAVVDNDTDRTLETHPCPTERAANALRDRLELRQGPADTFVEIRYEPDSED